MARQRDRESGFTLIELMIAVVIVGILLSIAIPSYQGYVRKGHRADAQAYLMDVAQRQHQYFTDTRAYAATVDLLHVPVPQSLTKYYTVAITTGSTPPSFQVTATAIGSQLPDGDLSLSNTGAKTPADKW